MPEEPAVDPIDSVDPEHTAEEPEMSPEDTLPQRVQLNLNIQGGIVDHTKIEFLSSYSHFTLSLLMAILSFEFIHFHEPYRLL